jgi:hypothetical protein
MARQRMKILSPYMKEEELVDVELQCEPWMTSLTAEL